MSFIQIRLKRDEHVIFESSVAQFSRAVGELCKFWNEYADFGSRLPVFIGHYHGDIIEHIIRIPEFSIELFNRDG